MLHRPWDRFFWCVWEMHTCSFW